MKALVLANGDYGDYSFCNQCEHYDVIICADNGTKHARYLGIIPDYILGDLDSASEENIAYFKEKSCIEKFSSEKDQTDTELAIDKAIALGAKFIDVYGGVGSRLDHTLGNVQLLYKGLCQGVEICLINTNNVVRLIRQGIILEGAKGDLISLIPFSENVKGITTTNLAYPLQRSTISWGQPYGISNYMMADKAEITIEEGLLLVIKASD